MTEKMTIKTLKDQGLILLECISGSKAYGTNVPGSDTDIKGVYLLPKDQFLGLDYVPQVSDEKNDEVYYELGRFIELLKKNNPNILELLASTERNTLVRHPIMDKIKLEYFLSKRCKNTFGGYAFTQVRKATGLDKKINNPMNKEKKSILDFCYVLKGQGSISLRKWLAKNGFDQSNIGLVNVPHFKDVYGIFHDDQNRFDYKGIQKKKEATAVLLSSIPKEETPINFLHFNQDGYKKYCKDYRDYWEWIELRNENRFLQNIEHGKNYDSKNMMHTMRLLDMAIEILETGKVTVFRPNREELLGIRRGEWTYDNLIETANNKMEIIEAAVESSLLPEHPDEAFVDQLLVNLRKELYGFSS